MTRRGRGVVAASAGTGQRGGGGRVGGGWVGEGAGAGAGALGTMRGRGGRGGARFGEVGFGHFRLPFGLGSSGLWLRGRHWGGRRLPGRRGSRPRGGSGRRRGRLQLLCLGRGPAALLLLWVGRTLGGGGGRGR